MFPYLPDMNNFVFNFQVDLPLVPDPPPVPDLLAPAQALLPCNALNGDVVYAQIAHQLGLLATMAEDMQDLLHQPLDGEENNVHIIPIPCPLMPHRWDQLNGPAYFRFEWDQLVELCNLLDLPEKFVTVNRTTMPCLEGLCLLIYHLSHPCRFKDLKLLFPRSEGALSELFNCILEYVYESWKHLLLFDHIRLTPQVLENFATATVCTKTVSIN